MGTSYQSILSVILIVFFILNQTVSIPLPPFPSASNLPYQAHSFNDVEYVRQLLKRGVKYFKIDVSMANRQSCMRNPNWNSSQKCYRTDQYAQQICCLALKGDTSARNSFDYKFSTIDDFISMLGEYLTNHAIDKILFFAVNHQFNFQFANQMSENATFKLAQMMQKHPQLYFAFGSDDFILEFDRVCRLSNKQNNHQKIDDEVNLKGLNTEACTAQRKFISGSQFILQSGSDSPSDPRDYHSRYRNFNVYYQQIENRCKNGFPSWIKKYPNFPLIFWEPSNERQIQLVLQAFMSDKCRLHHGRDLSGLAITSNIDPQVFQFYLKKANDSISQTQMTFYPNNEKVYLKNANNLLAKMTKDNVNYLVLGQQDRSNALSVQGSILQLKIFKIDSTGEKVSEISKKQLPPCQKTIKIVGGTDNVVVVQKQLRSTEDNANLIFLNANLQKITQLPVDKLIDVMNLRGIYYMVIRTAGSPNVFNLLKTTNFDKVSNIMSFSMLSEKAKSVNSFIAVQDQAGKLRFLLSGSINNTVWITQIGNDTTLQSGIVGFGINSKLIQKQNGMIVVSMQNGACNSAVLVNNGDVPLCQFYKYQEFKPMTSTKSTLTLIEFKYEYLIQRFGNQSSSPITPCIQKFVHYKAMNGRNINVVDLWSRLWMASEYVHISQQGMLNSLFCAASNYEFPKNNAKGILGTIWSRNNLGQNQKKPDQTRIFNE